MNKNIEADTNKINEATTKLNKLLIDYETKINVLFKRLDLGHTGDAWTGNNAVLYGKQALESKLDYLDYGEGIKDLVKEIEKFSGDLENQIKENEDTCENGQDESYGFMW